MPTTRIKVRSPYYKKYSHADLNYVELDIIIYTGIQIQIPSFPAPVYSLKKYVIGTNDYLVFELSELVRDYIETEFDGTYDNEPVWVRLNAQLYESDGTPIGSVSTSYLLAFDGYTLFEEGINYITDAPVFITDRVEDSNSEVTIYRPSDEVIRIPVNVDNTDGNETGWSFKLYTNNVEQSETSVSNSSNSSGQIYYINVGTQYDKVELYENEPSPSLPTKRYTIHIEEMDCNKYDAIKVTFYNRWGALQDLFFTAKHTETLTTKKEDYKSNLIDFSTLSYSTTRHQAQTFHKQGKERITLNTGNVNEDYNEWIKELMLSEKVWMTKDSTVYPIKVTSSNFRERTSINDKVFNYTIEAEYAFDKVQNIR